MSNTTRTPDDGRNERQRQQQEQDVRKERVPDDGRNERQRLLDEKPFDFIERTKPEDLIGHGGQLTRDNVNPNIPSSKPGGPPGPVVDPTTLGMEQGGVAPASADLKEAPVLPPGHGNASLNEPAGSDVGGGAVTPPVADPLVLSDISPDTLVVGSGTFPLSVTGSGFTEDAVVVFNDLDVPTTFVSATELTADCPVEAAPTIVDVEVHRGEDMSDMLMFEFTAVMREGREKRTPERKPKKETPRHKRANKRK